MTELEFVKGAHQLVSNDYKDLLHVVKAMASALNQIPNTKIKGQFESTYELMAWYDSFCQKKGIR